MATGRDYIFIGTIAHSESADVLQIILDGYVAVKSGKIVSVGPRSVLDSVRLGLDLHVPDTFLTDTQLLIPGLVDCHIHASQTPNIGLGYDKTLLEWLTAYTFPLESQYGDLKFATEVYETVVRRTLSYGTTTACYFATLHRESSTALARVAADRGQRALVGKVNMNAKQPAFYSEDTDDSVRETIEFINDVLGLNNELVQPIITPRFALSCDMDLMKRLAEIAASKNLNIQSHISENLGEVQAVRKEFPNCKNYADVYDKAKLLTNKTVMAHGVYLDDDELAIFAARGTSIAHCPSSNTNLGSGLCDVRRLHNAGINVGLGTDVSGGSSMSLLDAMRRAIDVSQHLVLTRKEEIQHGSHKPLNWKDAFYMATLGGAKALSLDKKIGNFQPGKDFDAILVDLAIPGCPIDLFKLPNALQNILDADNLQRASELLQKFIYLGDDRNITRVFVQGRDIEL